MIEFIKMLKGSLIQGLRTFLTQSPLSAAEETGNLVSGREKARKPRCCSSLSPSVQEPAGEESALGQKNMECFLKTIFLSTGIRDDKQFLRLILAREFVFKFTYTFLPSLRA